ncbi:MAG TPA: UDP-N-acetylmuramoyl-tripeptide--D-alanyl-D-alanine ligase [Acidobacteriota bacterium]|nr:UDP-N-acetylmuramoyl-tripeptide--D-alanyl-D-alanine ligase [Acidobacteriota bacterium]
MFIHEIGHLAGAKNLAELPAEVAEVTPVGFAIDSRSIGAGELFFAIQGAVFDGHAFVKMAFERGACAAILSADVKDLTDAERQRCLMVENTLLALQQLAHRLLTDWGRPVIGITGSAGKTTAKELTARTVSTCGRVHASVGNLNNTFGLPLTALKMISNYHKMDDFDFAVFEMGMSFSGEITQLTQIAPPHISVVLNVAPVHLENFDSIDGIAAAKAEIVHGLIEGGTAILNVDDPRVRQMDEIARAKNGKVVFFGRGENAQVRAIDVTPHGLLGTDFTLVTPKGTIPVHLPLPGEHFVHNALAAAAVALECGGYLDSIAAALEQGKPAPHRGEVLHFEAGFTVVDDSYNSNPQALQGMIKLLAAVPDARRTVLVAGEMLELGPDGAQMHAACGKFAAEHGVGLLIGVRGLAEHFLTGAYTAGLPHSQTYFAPDATQAGEWLAQAVRPGDVVLVKGSRGVRTELVIETLKHRFSVCPTTPTQTGLYQ